MSTAESNVFLQQDAPKAIPRSLATVTDTSSKGIKIRIDGELAAHSKTYKRLASYTPTVGDRVYIVPVSGTYIVIGKVI